jgi:hypothetical protein
MRGSRKRRASAPRGTKKPLPAGISFFCCSTLASPIQRRPCRPIPKAGRRPGSWSGVHARSWYRC